MLYRGIDSWQTDPSAVMREGSGEDKVREHHVRSVEWPGPEERVRVSECRPVGVESVRLEKAEGCELENVADRRQDAVRCLSGLGHGDGNVLTTVYCSSPVCD